MVRTDRSLSGTHLLCAVGRYQEACSQVYILMLFLVNCTLLNTSFAVLYSLFLFVDSYFEPLHSSKMLDAGRMLQP